MADKVQFDLVSPERLLVSEHADMVVVPGAEGDFGVLAGHAPFISAVRPGIIEIHEGTAVQQRIFVAGGFAEVTPERLTVLAEEAMPLERLDRGEIEAQLKTLQAELAESQSDAERARFAAAIGIAEAKLEALARA